MSLQNSQIMSPGCWFRQKASNSRCQQINGMEGINWKGTNLYTCWPRSPDRFTHSGQAQQVLNVTHNCRLRIYCLSPTITNLQPNRRFVMYWSVHQNSSKHKWNNNLKKYDDPQIIKFRANNFTILFYTKGHQTFYVAWSRP